jgi:hypothetical protein
MVLTAWLALVGTGAGASAACTSMPPLAGQVPPALQPLFAGAAETYGLGSQGPAILAGLTSVESDFGQDLGRSTAGAIGWTQFMPDTWARYGVDADGDGRRDPMNAADAIYSAAHYLRASGAPADWHAALLIYNHAEWYVRRVLDRARQFAGEDSTAPSADACALAALNAPGGVTRVRGGGAIVAIPGFPGERIDRRLLPDLLDLVANYHVLVTDGYSTSSVHAADGEHPLGLAVDLVPGPGGTWDDVDRLAAWAEPVQGQPRAPFRWVGYDGDPGHGRGNHLHLSWQHAPASGPPARWVDVFSAEVAP